MAQAKILHCTSIFTGFLMPPPCSLCGIVDKSYVVVYSDGSLNTSKSSKECFDSIITLLNGYFPGGNFLNLCRTDYRNIISLTSRFSKVINILISF